MRYTTLRVTERGIVLFALHRARLAPAGAAALREFDRFAAEAAPGVFGVWADDEGLRFEPRSTRMVDGMPARERPSPFAAHRSEWFPKPPPPGLYAPVRAPGVATLLTSTDGLELLESCSAAVVGWDGQRYVCVPRARPRVESVSELALRRELESREAPLPAGGGLPLLLLNAVKGPCRVALPGRAPFPDEAVSSLERLLDCLTARG